MSVSLSQDMLWFGSVNTPQEFISNLHSVNCPHTKIMPLRYRQQSGTIFLLSHRK